MLTFAKEGLRTLVVGQKLMDNKSAETLLKDIQKIKLDNISNQKKE